ncbi:MAG: hypothetical protein EAZ60_19385 [Oscillatoriales cyanobacterium]|nr:MAG: hypothetical protein EAZ83_07795 [Oscillatoriales cyanobacterium]TAE97329.1 MAG: hypothetical protein EAZ79_11510 [Oscillatoriales cyanobacterium]TAF21568.1 MAG: hypothetical protein EAZ73_08575 [Oscillatoriales cyanobacterium]TAF37723.1 MAG: hypothetical protein EAZ69_06555 [Oscillatoriales cyanobacterium]TAF53691.1 MAG: hypothetical protein EAZ60_19385 [Oscillatoriales cyanobacterium]
MAVRTFLITELLFVLLPSSLFPLPSSLFPLPSSFFLLPSSVNCHAGTYPTLQSIKKRLLGQVLNL